MTSGIAIVIFLPIRLVSPSARNKIPVLRLPQTYEQYLPPVIREHPGAGEPVHVPGQEAFLRLLQDLKAGHLHSVTARKLVPCGQAPPESGGNARSSAGT